MILYNFLANYQQTDSAICGKCKYVSPNLVQNDRSAINATLICINCNKTMKKMYYIHITHMIFNF